MARDQSQISHWDSTLEALGPSIDMDFIRTGIAEWMWDDFGMQSSIIIGADGKSRVTVFEDSVLAANDGRCTMAQSADLISLAKAKYIEHRRSRNGGFVIHQHPIRSERSILYLTCAPSMGS